MKEICLRRGGDQILYELGGVLQMWEVMLWGELMWCKLTVPGFTLTFLPVIYINTWLGQDWGQP